MSAEELQLPYLFYLALGFGVVFLTILYSINTIASSEAYTTRLYVMSLALDLQAIQADGKDLNVVETIADGGAYPLFFKGTEVYTEDRIKTNRFAFTDAPGYSFRDRDFQPKPTIGPIILYKTGIYYGAAKPSEARPYLLVCDSPEKSLNTFAIDPGDELLTLANRMRAGKPNFKLTRETNVQITNEEREKTPGDAFIGLYTGSYSDARDIVKAYYGPELGSKRLACEILDSITQELNVPVRLIPINPDYYSDPGMLTKRPAVLLEIGNANYKDSVLLKTTELKSAILKGMGAYE